MKAEFGLDGEIKVGCGSLPGSLSSIYARHATTALTFVHEM